MHDGQISNPGKFNFSTNLGECKVMLYGSDEDTAYFTLKTSLGEIKLKLFQPEYYGDEQPYRLNDIEKQDLYNFLLSDNSNGCSIDRPGVSNYQHLVLSWTIFNDFYSNYPEKEYAETIEIPPDYRRLM